MVYFSADFLLLAASLSLLPVVSNHQTTLISPWNEAISNGADTEDFGCGSLWSKVSSTTECFSRLAAHQMSLLSSASASVIFFKRRILSTFPSSTTVRRTCCLSERFDFIPRWAECVGVCCRHYAKFRELPCREVADRFSRG
ncbi:hypothetical protein BDV06DRAFT_195814 [Aspergillus oleicola]